MASNPGSARVGPIRMKASRVMGRVPGHSSLPVWSFRCRPSRGVGRRHRVWRTAKPDMAWSAGRGLDLSIVQRVPSR
jgi:hypothetical protein